MIKPIKEYQFRLIQGIWRDVAGDSADILADVLCKYGLQVDDKTEFARINDYTNKIQFWYRAYGGKITLTLCKLNPI